MSRMGVRTTTAIALVFSTVLLLGATASPSPTPEPEPTEDPVRAAEYWLDSTRVTQAWETTRGAGVRIAIIDTGVADVHGLSSAVVGGKDVSGLGSANGRMPVGTIDSHHGSYVGSLAAARGNPDGTGMIGVAPEASLLSLSVSFSRSAPVPFSEQIADAIRWSVDNGAQIINLSLTTNTPDWDPSWDDAFLYAYDNDVVVVVAAGNRGSGTNIVGAPATIPGVLTVGGVDQSGRASYEASTQGITIGVSAPSEALLGISADGVVMRWDGTSGAAPIVAGIAALVRSAHPNLDAANVINRIIQTATPAIGARGVPDPIYGYGIINAEAAVNANVTSVQANPMGDLREWVRVFRRAESAVTPEPTVTPVEVLPLPVAESPTVPGSPLLPSLDSLRYGTLPLVAVTLPAILIGLGVTAAARRIRSARISRAPNRE